MSARTNRLLRLDGLVAVAALAGTVLLPGWLAALPVPLAGLYLVAARRLAAGSTEHRDLWNPSGWLMFLNARVRVFAWIFEAIAWGIPPLRRRIQAADTKHAKGRFDDWTPVEQDLPEASDAPTGTYGRTPYI